MKRLVNTIDIIDRLGGNEAVANLFNPPAHYKAVANWRYFNIFPANTYLVLTKALNKRGFTAPDTLWNMKPGAPHELLRSKQARAG
jgi:hypothetical protein